MIWDFGRTSNGVRGRERVNCVPERTFWKFSSGDEVLARVPNLNFGSYRLGLLLEENRDTVLFRGLM